MDAVMGDARRVHCLILSVPAPTVRDEMNDDYVTRARRHASRWKATTTTLPEGARGPAAYLRAGQPRGMYPFWLPAGYATYNLLPDIRDAALAEFATKAIAWHGQTPLGPTNHLLSSQV